MNDTINIKVVFVGFVMNHMNHVSKDIYVQKDTVLTEILYDVREDLIKEFKIEDGQHFWRKLSQFIIILVDNKLISNNKWGSFVIANSCTITLAPILCDG